VEYTVLNFLDQPGIDLLLNPPNCACADFDRMRENAFTNQVVDAAFRQAGSLFNLWAPQDNNFRFSGFHREPRCTGMNM
jgi:hypothetical protein